MVGLAGVDGLRPTGKPGRVSGAAEGNGLTVHDLVVGTSGSCNEGAL